jgi:hypothetical protein
MSEQVLEQMRESEQPRPSFLKVLCILSFISIGLAAISSMGSLVAGPTDAEVLEQQKVEMLEMSAELRDSGMSYLADVAGQMQRMSESLNDHFYPMATLSLAVIILGFIGVLLMWKGKRLGFHLYIIYNLIGLANIYLFVSPSDIPTFAVLWNLFISGLFILMYSKNLHWMNK